MKAESGETSDPESTIDRFQGVYWLSWRQRGSEGYNCQMLRSAQHDRGVSP